MNNDNQMKLPEHYEWIGEEIRQGGLKMFIKKIILDEIESYLESDKKTELGGILIGDCISDVTGKIIKIEDIIIARHTESALTKLTFTHETWIDINNVLEKDFPGKKITGWFHSHPGHGVFMSGYDKFIHENFFNTECMVAMVYDPVKKERGFFCLKDENIIEIDSYGIYSDEKRELYQPLRLSANADNNSFRKKINLRDILFYGLLIISAIMLFLIIDTRSDNEYLNIRISEQQKETDSLKSQIKNFSDILNSIGNFGIKDTIKGFKYTVKPGDNLKSIAIRFYDNPAMFDTLVSHNKLKNEFDIYPGKEIEIP